MIGMAEIRTEEQREEIAQECLRIEKAGGDVLGYLHGLNYISARATWIRLQKEFLGRRKEWQLTDGKPKKKKEAVMVARPGRGKYEQHLFRLLDVMDAGEDRDKILQGLGYEDPRKAYQNLRLYARQRHPEVMDRFPDLLKRKADAQRKPKTKEEKEEVKMDDQTEMVVQPVDPAELGEAEREPVAAGPEENDGFLVTAVQCAGLGEFYYDHLHECIDWRDGYGDEISLGVDGWRMLMERLPAILARLGVTV